MTLVRPVVVDTTTGTLRPIHPGETFGFGDEATGVVNVMDPAYGAVGDGSTNDHTAIAAAIATGRTVFFPPAVYAIGAGLIVSTAGQALVGYGATLKKTANVDGVAVSADRCRVIGLTVDGNAHAGAGILVTANRCIVRDCVAKSNGDGFVVHGPNTVPGADLNIITGCEAYGNSASGFHLHNATDQLLSDSISQTNGFCGVLAEAKCFSLTLVNLHIDDNNTGNLGGSNLKLSESDAARILASVITNCEHGGHGIDIDSTAAAQSGFTIDGNALAQNGGYGVKIGAAAGHTSNRAILTANRLNGNTSGTVLIETGCSGNILVANDFDGDAISDAGTGTIAVGNDVSNIGTTLSSAFFQQSLDTAAWQLTAGTEGTAASNADISRFSNNTATNIEWSLGVRLPAGSYSLELPLGLGAGFGIARALIDGEQVATSDRYSAAEDTYPTVTLDLGAISAGGHTLAITCTTKNGSASGKQLVLRGARLYQYA